MIRAPEAPVVDDTTTGTTTAVTTHIGCGTAQFSVHRMDAKGKEQVATGLVIQGRAYCATCADRLLASKPNSIGIFGPVTMGSELFDGIRCGDGVVVPKPSAPKPAVRGFPQTKASNSLASFLPGGKNYTGAQLRSLGYGESAIGGKTGRVTATETKPRGAARKAAIVSKLAVQPTSDPEEATVVSPPDATETTVQAPVWTESDETVDVGQSIVPAPEMPEEAAAQARMTESAEAPTRAPGPVAASVTLHQLLAAGVLVAPCTIERTFHGTRYTAMVQDDGSVLLGDTVYRSLSLAGEAVDTEARPDAAVHHINGWTFWRTEVGGQLVQLDHLRRQLGPVAPMRRDGTKPAVQRPVWTPRPIRSLDEVMATGRSERHRNRVLPDVVAKTVDEAESFMWGFLGREGPTPVGPALPSNDARIGQVAQLREVIEQQQREIDALREQEPNYVRALDRLNVRLRAFEAENVELAEALRLAREEALTTDVVIEGEYRAMVKA